jgi:hypothetical protein
MQSFLGKAQYHLPFDREQQIKSGQFAQPYSDAKTENMTQYK